MDWYATYMFQVQHFVLNSTQLLRVESLFVRPDRDCHVCCKFWYMIKKNAQNALWRKDCDKMRVCILIYKNILLKYAINRKRSPKKFVWSIITVSRLKPAAIRHCGLFTLKRGLRFLNVVRLVGRSLDWNVLQKAVRAFFVKSWKLFELISYMPLVIKWGVAKILDLTLGHLWINLSTNHDFWEKNIVVFCIPTLLKDLNLFINTEYKLCHWLWNEVFPCLRLNLGLTCP